MKPRTLEQFQREYPDGLDSIAVDVVGFCNAKCTYCPAGGDLSTVGQFMSVEKYRAILKKLMEYKLCSAKTNIHIYCLGEPCLHPSLNEILKITSDMGLQTAVSTNASKIPVIDGEGLKGVKRVLISVPGFSQASYNRIHGFDFDIIKKNILELMRIFKNIPFDMSYHIYQFNLNEIDMAKRFCETYGIRFALNYAILMDINKRLDYVNNKMEYQELKKTSQEIIMGLLDQQIADSLKNYCVFQERFLSITVAGNINICSAFSRDYWSQINCGNLLSDNIDTIIERKFFHKKCDQCIAAGLATGYGYDCKIWPDFYYSQIKENDYLRDMISEHFSGAGDLIDYELKIVHQIRHWEQDHFSEEELKKAVQLINMNKVSKERLKSLIEKYARFGISSYDKLMEKMLY